MKLLLGLLLSMSVHAKTIKVALIDSGIDHFTRDIKLCPNGLYDLTGNLLKMHVTKSEMTDKFGHGTNVAYLIADRLKDVDYCFYIFKIYEINENTKSLKPTMLAFLLASNLNVDVINYSSGGPDEDPLEQAVIKTLTDKGIKLVTAAGNLNLNLDTTCNYFPCCYDDVICVGNIEDTGMRQEMSNYGKRVNHWEKGCNVHAGGWIMTGTSQAAALYSSKIVRDLAK